MPYSCFSSVVLLVALYALRAFAQDDNPCKSFGIDFQDHGNYFQDSDSTDNFTFVSEFEGCQPDVCYNILVDPSGNSVECSNTQLTPDDTPQLSTCPTLKDQLVTGPWSVILISNNGDGESIAYERDFDLTVGPQQTVTVTPTITVPVTSVVILNSTSTVTDVASNTTLPASTVFVASTTVVPTKTIAPQRVTSTTTKTIATVTVGKPTVQVVKSTKIVTPSCTVPSRQPTQDPQLSFKLPSLRGPNAALIQSIIAKVIPSLGLSSKFNKKPGNPVSWRFNGRTIDLDKEEFLQARNARMLNAAAHIVKRAPDQPTVTINATNTADYPTITSTILTTSTATITTTLETTGTITPAPVTVVSGQATGSTVTVTAATPTRVITRYTVATTSVHKVTTTTIIITSTTTPAASVTACKNKGGHFKLWN